MESTKMNWLGAVLGVLGVIGAYFASPEFLGEDNPLTPDTLFYIRTVFAVVGAVAVFYNGYQISKK